MSDPTISSTFNSQEIYEKISSLYEQFQIEHLSKSKAAHGRARKILGEIKKLVGEYKKASITEDKQK